MIALVSPMRREARALSATAVGAGGACREDIARLLDGDRPLALLIAGVCGGLDPSLGPGGLVLCRQAVMEERPELRPDAALFEAARHALLASGHAFVSSRLLTIDRPVVSRQEKTALWNEHGAAGVDMETYLLAEAAEARGLPWLALRAVLDPAWRALPATLASWRDEGDDLRVLSRLARRPHELPGAIGVALALRRALGALRGAVPRVAAAATAAAGGEGRMGEGASLVLREIR